MRMVLLGLLAPLLLAQPTTADDELNLGAQAFRRGKYAQAAQHFAAAVRLDPGYLDARVYLAQAHVAQYTPGSDAPENLEMARRAMDEFQQVLVLDPENDVALGSIALLYYHQKKFEDAQEWYEKLSSLDPDNKEAWYTLGVIAWNRFYPAYTEARAKAGLEPTDPGPLPDAKAREALKSHWGGTVADGIENLERALRIDPEYDDAMAYLNLLIRERADWAPSQREYIKQIESADGWVHKALEIKKRKAEGPIRRP